MRSGQAVGLLIFVLTACGCSQGSAPASEVDERHTPAAGAITSPNTFAMPGCGALAYNKHPDKTDVVGVIRIVLPKNLNLRNLASHRKVKNDLGSIDVASAEDGVFTGGSSNPEFEPIGREANRPIGASTAKNPFHIYMGRKPFGTIAPSDTPKYVLVRIIIPRRSDNWNYEFFEYKPDGTEPSTHFHGVGRGELDNGGVLCGNFEIVPKENRFIAMFYIDLKKLYDLPAGSEPSFNIGIQSTSAPETPIFIDPKVPNNG